MIKSFADRTTEKIFNLEPAPRIPADIVRRAQLKLAQLHFAEALDDLRSPPGNRLEALAGDRRGQYSIRINNQWRICFRWKNGECHAVEIVDYHR